MESHFSFTRNSSDSCALHKRDKQSKGPGQYATDTGVQESPESCFMASAPFQHNPFRSVPKNVVDIESELRGQNRNLSKCPECINAKTNLQVPQQKECTNVQLVPEYTRTNRTCNILSEIKINRFQPLFEDPQALNRIHLNSFIGSNTRLRVKDAFDAADKLSKK